MSSDLSRVSGSRHWLDGERIVARSGWRRSGEAAGVVADGHPRD